MGYVYVNYTYPFFYNLNNVYYKIILKKIYIIIMINITRNGNNVIVTSDNPNAFNISNGELSVPMNSIYYVLDDESDFIQFNSIDEKGEILFNGIIGDIQVNGTLVTREDIQVKLDAVFNSSGSGGTAGVESINGLQGSVTLKTINGQELTGEGNIEIQGGSSEPEQYVVSIDDFLIYTKDEPYKKLWLQYKDSSNKSTIITKEIILEWTGTQSEYDALGTYDDSITYNIIEG